VSPPKAPDLGRSASRAELEEHYNMHLGEGIPNVCAGPSPYFTFDSSKPKQSEPTMQTLANCMIDGPLKNKSIILIGHTDPRGAEAHNDKLGLKRADDVKKYLVTQGVDGERIMTATAGEDLASDAPKDWPTDRRVQVKIAK
jgi:peptidoglycan-associated lipoprotein